MQNFVPIRFKASFHPATLMPQSLFNAFFYFFPHFSLCIYFFNFTSLLHRRPLRARPRFFFIFHSPLNRFTWKAIFAPCSKTLRQSFGSIRILFKRLWNDFIHAQESKVNNEGAEIYGALLANVECLESRVSPHRFFLLCTVERTKQNI